MVLVTATCYIDVCMWLEFGLSDIQCSRW